MKKIINALNGTLEFDKDDDVEIFRCYLNAKNVWVFVGEEHQRFKILKYDHIVAMHIFGKNTIASPQIILNCRLQSLDNGTFTSASNVCYDLNALTMQSMADINFLLTSDQIKNLLTDQFDNSLLQLRIDSTSVFTGYLYINVYIKRNAR